MQRNAPAALGRLPHVDCASAVARQQAARNHGRPVQRIALRLVAGEHLARRHPSRLGRGSWRAGLAVQRQQQRLDVPHLHVARLRPRRNHVRRLRLRANAVDTPANGAGERAGRRSVCGNLNAPVVRDGAALQHRLPGRVAVLVAVVAVVAVVLAVPHFRQLRQARHGERVVARRVGLRARNHVHGVRELDARLAQLVTHDVEAAGPRGWRQSGAAAQRQGAGAQPPQRRTRLRHGHSS
jgi:hypothetical protein